MTTSAGQLRRIIWLGVRFGAVGALVFFLGREVVKNWPAIRAGWHPPAPAFATAAVVVLFGSYLWLYAISLALLRRLGYKLTFGSGLRPFFYSLLGRYIPGRFAVVVGKAYFYQKRRIPTLTAAFAPTYENVLAAVGGAAFAVAASAAVFPGQLGWGQLFAAAAAAIILVIGIQPALVKRAVAWAGTALKAKIQEAPTLATKHAAVLACAYAVYCVLFAAFFAFAARAFTPLSAGECVRVGAACGVAAVLGYVVVLTPSGLGVREGLLLLLVRPYIPHAEAAFLAVASRAVTLAAELLLAGAAAGLGNDRPATPISE